MRHLLRATLVLAFLAASASGGENGDKPDFPPFAAVTKDLEAKKGLWTLYHDEKSDKLLAAIPSGMLQERFLVGTSISSGPFFASWQWVDMPVYFERLNKKLVLLQADPRYAKGEGTELEDVIGRTYTDTVLSSVDIVTETPGGDPVIDLADLCKTDLVGVGRLFGGSVNRSLCKFSSIKPFEHNLELTVDLAVMGNGPGGSGTLAAVHYSIARIPKSDYKPRKADDRVGYFLTVVKNWARPHEDKTVFDRYINRWHLKPVDPEATVSDVTADTQIIFYLEDTIPKKYRRYVREGILEWNKAFEKAGLRNAIQVRQQTDTVFADLDPEDMNYNFIRWIVSGRPFARGPSRVNPFTGQIIDADIVVDDSMIRYVLNNEFKVFGPRAQLGGQSDALLEQFLEAHPQWGVNPPQAQAMAPALALKQAEEPFDPAEPLHRLGEPSCEYGAGLAQQLAFGGAVMAAAGDRELPEEFIGQAIKELVAHEVGHTLGLRHNFKASSWLSLPEIKSAKGEMATSASVMDYNDYTFAASDIEQGQFVTSTLGPYDHWAIEYGYRPVAEPFKNEEELLSKVLERATEPGLAYATDEDRSVLQPDPLVNAYDDGNDPIAYARDRMQAVQRLRKNITDWAVEDGESWNRLRRTFDMLLGVQGRAAQFAARLVGGQYVNRYHKGDPDAQPPFVVVPAEKQREALRFLGETIFSDASFEFPPEVLTKLAAGRWLHWDSEEADFFIDYPVHDRVRGVQGFILFQLLNPWTLNRVYDNQAKVPADADALTVPELFTTLNEMIWSELESAPQEQCSARKPMISSIRRGLQREHLGRLIDITLLQPGTGLHADCHAIARAALQDLQSRIDAGLASCGDKADPYSKAHLQDARERIGKALEAEFKL